VRPVKTITAAIAVAGVCLLAVDARNVVSDGSFPLTVVLRSANADRLVRVWTAPMSRRDFAEELRDSPHSANSTLREVDNFREPFVVQVPWSSSTSGLGRERWYANYRVLVLRAEYFNGETEWVLVDIPDNRQSRTVEVSFP
jgi:hypothetical protein